MTVSMHTAASGSRVAGAFTADDEVAVVVVAQPRCTHSSVSNPSSHITTRASTRGVECVRASRRACGVHCTLPCEDLGAAHRKALASRSTRAQGDAGGGRCACPWSARVSPWADLRPLLRSKYARQVIKCDGGMEVEQPHRPVEQVVLRWPAASGPSAHRRRDRESHRPHGLEVLRLQQLAQGAAAHPSSACRVAALGARTLTIRATMDVRWPNCCAATSPMPELLEQACAARADPHRLSTRADMLDVRYRAAGATSSSESTSTRWISCSWAGAGAPARSRGRGVGRQMRWACASTMSGGQSGVRVGAVPAELHSSMRRAQHLGQALCHDPDTVSSQIEQGALSHLRADRMLGAHERKVRNTPRFGASWSAVRVWVRRMNLMPRATIASGASLAQDNLDICMALHQPLLDHRSIG